MEQRKNAEDLSRCLRLGQRSETDHDSDYSACILSSRNSLTMATYPLFERRVILAATLLVSLLVIPTTHAFVGSSSNRHSTKMTQPRALAFHQHHQQNHAPIVLRMDASDSSIDDHSDEPLGDGGGVVIEDLMWRVEKLRLEENNKKRFLQSKPRFLPYQECRKWVQAWGLRWETAEDWEDWISMGEKKNPYIPSQPDEYYGRLGQWVSWEHFLLIPPSEDDDDDEEESQEKREKEFD